MRRAIPPGRCLRTAASRPPWEGKKGEPSKPVMPLDLNVRPVLDGNYIIPKTVDYIKRNAAAKKPFFVYVGYSEVHPPVIGNPEFVGKSTQRGGLYSDVIGEMDTRVGQIAGSLCQVAMVVRLTNPRRTSAASSAP
jgi:hypothetical protein